RARRRRISSSRRDEGWGKRDEGEKRKPSGGQSRRVSIPRVPPLSLIPHPSSLIPISRHKRLHAVARTGDDRSFRRYRSDEHRPIERLTRHQIRELRSGPTRVANSQQAAPPELRESGRKRV